jgi:hypothetical protein
MLVFIDSLICYCVLCGCFEVYVIYKVLDYMKVS